jgi:hypothetical protein
MDNIFSRDIEKLLRTPCLGRVKVISLRLTVSPAGLTQAPARPGPEWKTSGTNIGSRKKGSKRKKVQYGYCLYVVSS